MSSANSLEKAHLRHGDFHLRDDGRRMFGNATTLGAGRGQRASTGVVETPIYDEPRLWRLEVLFRLAGVGDYTPWLPSGAPQVVVTARRALDRDKAVAQTSETLTPIDYSPSLPSAFNARYLHGTQVGVNVALVDQPDANTPAIDVLVSIVPVDGGARDGYGNGAIFRFAADTTSQLLLPANAARRQFFVQNMATSPLYIALDTQAAGPADVDPRFSIALLNVGDIYESPRDCYLGPVAGVWAAVAAAASDVAMVTEGT